MILFAVRYKIEMVKYWATTELDSYAKMTRVSLCSVAHVDRLTGNALSLNIIEYACVGYS